MQFFFFKDSATTEIYTLSLHDALPISRAVDAGVDLDTLIRGELLAHPAGKDQVRISGPDVELPAKDRKSTRLNSSHANISYAVFCLKKKKISTNLYLQITRLTSIPATL